MPDMPRCTKPLTSTEINSAKSHNGKPIVLYDGGDLELLVKPQNKTNLWRFRYYKPLTHKRAMISFGVYPAVSGARVACSGH